MSPGELESFIRRAYRDCAEVADIAGATEVANTIRRLADGLDVTSEDNGMTCTVMTLRPQRPVTTKEEKNGNQSID